MTNKQTDDNHDKKAGPKTLLTNTGQYSYTSS